MMEAVDKIKKKRKITWVTPDYFVDCDFNPEILRAILAEYEIHWIIIFPHHNARFSVTDFEQLKELKGLTLEFMYSQSRQRNPRRIFFYFKLFRRIINTKPNLIYLNCVPDPYFVPIIWLFKKKKTIFCAHDGGVHAGFDFNLITDISFKLSYRFVKFVCMFSPSQARLFQKNFPRANVNVIPLGLKNFGESNFSKTPEVITFLCFGVINYSKNIDLLIEAACNIYEGGYRNFKVSINGKCDNWNYYQSLIRYPEIFECNIRLIRNDEIPNLFSSAHYFVQPYRHVSQSGAMKVAFQYNLPVIATDFPGFKDEIKNGVNGYLFERSNVDELEKIMANLIVNHKMQYADLSRRMATYTHETYSPAVIGRKYIQMFNEVIEPEGE